MGQGGKTSKCIFVTTHRRRKEEVQRTARENEKWENDERERERKTKEQG
jgi:hypothetical protein